MFKRKIAYKYKRKKMVKQEIQLEMCVRTITDRKKGIDNGKKNDYTEYKI